MDGFVSAHKCKGTCNVPDQEVGLRDFLAACNGINGIAAAVDIFRLHSARVLLLRCGILLCGLTAGLVVRFARRRICLSIRTVLSTQVLIGITCVFSRAPSCVEGLHC